MYDINEGLIFEGELPLTIKHLSAPPTTHQLARSNTSNESLLKSSLMLHDTPEFDEHDEISQELRRQSVKIDLLLDLVGELLSQQNSFPAEIPLKLTPSYLSCHYCSDFFQPELGKTVEVAIYLTPPTPKALILYGQILSIDDSINKTNYTIDFLGINQVVQDSLEKIIFRHHRRSIAQNLLSK